MISIGYNATIQMIFPGMPSLDVNGNPKIMPAEILRLMRLASRDWFVEAEVMLKARHLRLNVIEFDVLGKPRDGGRSHVRFATIGEFMWNLVAYRFGGPWREWKRSLASATPAIKAEEVVV